MIALDVDGVLLDFVGHWETVAEYVLGFRPTKQTDSFAMSKRYGLPEAAASLVWERYRDGSVWGNIPPLPGAVETVQALINIGRKVVAITSVPTHAVGHRERAMAQWFPGVTMYQAESMAPGHKNGEKTKEEWLCILRPLAFIDDRWAHIQEGRNAGVPLLARVYGGHDGGGVPVENVNEYLTLRGALMGLGML